MPGCRGWLLVCTLAVLLPSCILGRVLPHGAKDASMKDLSAVTMEQDLRATVVQMRGERRRKELEGCDALEKPCGKERRVLMAYTYDYVDPVPNTNPGAVPPAPPSPPSPPPPDPPGLP